MAYHTNIYIPKIIVSGYMASGKTSVARELGRYLRYPVVDLDSEIEQREGMGIPEIFEKKGEVYFRKAEHRILVDLLSQPGNMVLSVGGGTPCYANNHLEFIGNGKVSVFLKTSVPELARRIEADGTIRPLVKGLSGEPLEQFIAQHLFERNDFYRHARYSVNTDGRTPEEIAREIAALTQVS